jgi:hypothetical protein
MSNILCEKPKYILNPAFKDALLRTGKYVYDGNATFVPEMQLAAWRWNFPYALFSPKAIDSQNFASYQDSYYAIDRDDDAVHLC